MASISKPRFSGEDVVLKTRYEYFVYYMEHYEYVVNSKPIYIQNFEATIEKMMRKTSRMPNNLLSLSIQIGKESIMHKELSAIGMVAQKDAMIYTMEALEYSRDKILETITIGE